MWHSNWLSGRSKVFLGLLFLTTAPSARSQTFTCDVNVTTVGLTFVSQTTTINVGQTVCFLPGQFHNVIETDSLGSCTALAEPSFGSEVLGDPAQHTFNEAGTFFFKCTPHCAALMTGVVQVLSATQSDAPTLQPTNSPGLSPSSSPTSRPTDTPSSTPTAIPTDLPSANPTGSPSASVQTEQPSAATTFPTAFPAASPNASPTALPSAGPVSAAPSTSQPSQSPTNNPVAIPTAVPTAVPSVASSSPSVAPSDSAQPSESPTAVPSQTPTTSPTVNPTAEPTAVPTSAPLPGVTLSPTALTAAPVTLNPTGVPSLAPTATPSRDPTAVPTNTPSTAVPSVAPSSAPTSAPSSSPTATPSATPTVAPSGVPTNAPTSGPTNEPTATPTTTPSASPTSAPTTFASNPPLAAVGFERASSAEGACDPRRVDSIIAEFSVPNPFTQCGDLCGANDSCFGYDINASGVCRHFRFEIPVSLVGVTAHPDIFCYARSQRASEPCVDVAAGSDVTLTCPFGEHIALVYFAATGGSIGSCLLGFQSTGYCNLTLVSDIVKNTCGTRATCTLTSADFAVLGSNSCATGQIRILVGCLANPRFLTNSPTAAPPPPSTTCVQPTCAGLCDSPEPQRKCDFVSAFFQTNLQRDNGINTLCFCDSQCGTFLDCCDDFADHCTTTTSITSTTTRTTRTTTFWAQPTTAPSASPTTGVPTTGTPTTPPVTGQPSMRPTHAPSASPTPHTCSRHFNCDDSSYCHANNTCQLCSVLCIPGTGGNSATGHCPAKCLSFSTTSTTTVSTSTVTPSRLCSQGVLSADNTICCPARCSSSERPYNCSEAGQQQYCSDFPAECIPLGMQCNPATYTNNVLGWLPSDFVNNRFCSTIDQTTCVIPP
eukprot:m.48078 g.48078  ORF g.48078 m.48078 type:complete len:883 (-) comp8896_c0_seq1:24-2672(-)